MLRLVHSIIQSSNQSIDDKEKIEKRMKETSLWPSLLSSSWINCPNSAFLFFSLIVLHKAVKASLLRRERERDEVSKEETKKRAKKRRRREIECVEKKERKKRPDLNGTGVIWIGFIDGFDQICKEELIAWNPLNWGLKKRVETHNALHRLETTFLLSFVRKQTKREKDKGLRRMLGQIR